VDGQGRMRPQALAERLLGVTGPIIVCAQAGNVNTGAFDPVGEIAALTRRAGAWLHVDGAFGLWARASGRRQALGDGLERADSWATDAHKYLNVPYDSGLVFVANRDAHRAAMSTTASYLLPTADRREPLSWVPESSRLARVVPIYAALASLGRDGVAALVDRCADLAQRMAARLSAAPGITILNDVVLNQVLVRFAGPDGRSCSAEVIAAVQREGTCWAGSSAWQGETVMRISVSNWSTSESDIDRSADAIAACHARVVRDLASA